MAQRAKQLYRRPSAINSAQNPYTTGGTFLADVSEVPSIEWPDGRHCFEASLFLFKLFYEDGLSTLGGGGSLTTYASYLSHLIRYCFQEKVEFRSIRDARFVIFIQRLISETKVQHGQIKPQRENNTIIKMGRFYLKFFEFIGKLHGIEAMVGEKILAIRKEGTRKFGNHISHYEYWDHRCFPVEDEERHRRPLKDTALEKIFSANNQISKTKFIHKRRYVLLLLLKATGCRRIEVAMLKTAAIKKALKSSELLPMLELPNVKQKGGARIRKIPISRGDLLEIEKYMLERAKVIRTTCGTHNDSDFLLINTHTGQGLVPNTITTEFALLAKHAQLDSQACAHMLRHRYLVNLFIELILEAGTTDKDVFIQLLFSDDDLHLKLRERSGHMTSAGIKWYTKLALEKLKNVEGALKHLQARESVKGLKARIENVERLAAEEKLSAEEELHLLKKELGIVVADVDALTKFDID